MAKGKCKCKATECEECPEWIFTFADLVMLMMGFFVILWVLKPAPGKSNAESDAEWNKIAAAIREAFDYIPDPKSTDPIDLEIIKHKLQDMKPQKGSGEKGKARLETKGADGVEQEVTTIRPGRQAEVGGRVLFDTGSSALTPDGLKMLDGIIPQIKGFRNIVLIKGHTALDDFPESASALVKMDLSLRRAQIVADYLTNNGVSPDTLRVQGCSTFEPVAERAYTPDVRSINRRVEVEVTTTLVAERQDPSHSTTTTQPFLPLEAGSSSSGKTPAKSSSREDAALDNR